MVTIGKQIELGKGLLKEFYRLDSEINSQQLEQDRFTRNALIDEVNFFMREAEKYIDAMQDFINSKEILLKSTIDMLKKCGYQVIVEGVESEEIANLMKESHVDFIQGFYYAKPMNVEDTIKFIKERNA